MTLLSVNSRQHTVYKDIYVKIASIVAVPIVRLTVLLLIFRQ